jgi:signal transduction histidine kinase
MLDVQHAERCRLAAALHDDPVQVLTVAMMRLDLLAGSVTEASARTQFDEARDAVRTALEQLRRMQYELHPPSLERDGIAAALREYAGPGVTIEAAIGREPSLGVASALFRIAREVLGNAGASHVHMRERDGGFEVRIANDGDDRGLEFAADLARAAGGSWSISRTPQAGTTVEFWLPGRSAA